MEHPLRTVYFGGGTPSLLPVGQLAQVVDAIRNHYDTTALEEVTIEANPEDLTPAYLADLRGLAFFNRVSIGVQSFHDDDLRLLNRRHDSRQAFEALENTVAAGFEHLFHLGHVFVAECQMLGPCFCRHIFNIEHNFAAV